MCPPASSRIFTVRVPPRIGNAVRVFIIHYRNRVSRGDQSTVARTLEALRASPHRLRAGCVRARAEIFHAVQDDRPAAFKHVVELRGAFVIVKLASLDVHGVGPRRGGERRFFAPVNGSPRVRIVVGRGETAGTPWGVRGGDRPPLPRGRGDTLEFGKQGN